MSRLRDSIAIVGIGCRYPDARSPRELWENVLARRRAFRRIPPERLRLEDYFSEDGSAPDSIYSTQAALLEGYEFDRPRFRIGERAYRSADLAHWLALDIASQALADAGFPEGEGLEGETTGVLVGNSLTGEFSRAGLLRLRWPYVRRQVAAALSGAGWDADRQEAFLRRLEKAYKEPFPETTEETLAGGLSNTIAGRICNHFDFHGGGYTVDGACSSSLLAVANACSALVAGDLEVALAGGVDLSLDPFELVGFARTRALAAGEMWVYDRRAAGFIPGEGCGFVVLMPQRAAVERGLRVYAVLRGWGISSDGRGGLTRPEQSGQLAALRRAYHRAGFGVETVGLFEGHGTGTAVGDATELAALDEARRQAGAATRVAIGSIKANIGHTKAAAGVAGLIKASLALHHRLLPPATGCEELHPQLTRDDGTLRILQRPELWPEDLPLRASVSAMGFGGINCHLALEGAGTRRRRRFTDAERLLLPAPPDAEVFFLAGAGEADLARQVELLARRAGTLARAELVDLAAELARRVTPATALRAAVVAATPRELEERLEDLRSRLDDKLDEPWLDLEAGVFAGRAHRPPRVSFLFPGQGSPSRLDGGLWRRRFPAAEEIYRQASLPADGDAVETAVAQPAIVTASLAALAVLDRLGVEGTAAIGHSLGELTALHWAGAWDEGALLRLAAARGRGMSELAAVERSTMASLGVAAGEVDDLLAGLDADRLTIAGYNAPTQTVISGLAEDVETAVAAARARGWKAHLLDVSHAFHSPFVAAAVPRLEEALRGEKIGTLRRRVCSTVTGGWLEPGCDLRALLCRQITSPTRFRDALATAAPEADIYLEVGPGEVLSGLARPQVAVPVIALDAGGASLRGLLRTAGTLFALGAPLDLRALFSDRFTRPFDLERKPSFLVNPCEMAPLDGAMPPQPAAESTARTPGAPAVEALAEVALPATSPLELVRELIARRAELSPAAITDDSRLLSDLHMSSIAVGELVTEAARRLDQPPPFAPTEYADATVAEVARALDERATGGAARERARELLPPGIDAWTRVFTVEWVERRWPRIVDRAETGRAATGRAATGRAATGRAATGRAATGRAATGRAATGRPAVERQWRVLAPPDHPLLGALEKVLAGSGGGTVLCLPAGIGGEHVDRMLAAGRAVLADRHGPLVLVQPGAAAAPFFRTLHLEAPEIRVAVVDVPADLGSEPEAWCRRVRDEALAVHRYSETRYDSQGRRFQPVLRRFPGPPTPAPEAPPLAEGDVLLVTGGGKGITAESALEIARCSGARLALIGRSQPQDDEELRAHLTRLEAHRVRFRYLAADVTDGASVAAAVARVRKELGEIRGVLHGAGTNVPRLISVLDRADVERTLAPKVGGLRHVLDAVDRGRLKLLVGFGSIIARAGLPGEADYALANDQLRREIERFAGEHPECRSLCVDWSVWSGLGMGARLGRLEALTAQGITPITTERGIEVLKALMMGSRPPVSVVVCGRFGEPPTLEVERPELPLARFLEQPRVYFPGVELVVDNQLSHDTDPYLGEHVFDGQRLFPAVMGLEAIAQAVAALTGRQGPPVFHDVRFERPISVSEGGTTTLRVAALARRSGEVEVALRSDVTAFQVDHFRALCRPPDGAAPEPLPPPPEPDDGELLPVSPAADLYGPVLFQAGRFRRLQGYRELRARSCQADVGPSPGGDWFSPYLPADLLLGDPGARDAFIHCVQACIPHATVLPTAVERLTAGKISGPGPYRVAARERSHHERTLVYDLEVRDRDGGVVELWQGLELRVVGRRDNLPLLAPQLLGPYLQRRFEDLVPGAALAVAVDRNGHGDRRRRGRRALGRALGHPVAVLRRPDGKPEVDGHDVSIAHSGELVMAVAGHGAVACDLEPVESRCPELWHDLLGASRRELLDFLIRERGEDRDAAATRIWTVLESLRKAGYLGDAPIRYASASDDGWVLFECGRLAAGTVLFTPAGSERPFAFAVLAARGEAEVAPHG